MSVVVYAFGSPVAPQDRDRPAERTYLPQELGLGSGMTGWRRLAAWNEAGVWDQPYLVLLKKLRVAVRFWRGMGAGVGYDP
ncbi:hypothetical protein ACFYNW_37545 [Streptomyces virginiae]|uniref:hypothetical protein n=1 Tax=Streptomyces virginiae TaxID=1961 RepID=UPI0036E3FEA4